MADPLHNFRQVSNLSPGSANRIIQEIATTAPLAGWILDQLDVTPNIETSTGGYEVYIHSISPNLSQQTYISAKAFRGTNNDHSGIAIFINTGYDSQRRVDNQPGMYARHNNAIINAAPVNEVFSGLWDAGGVNADPIDPGLYKTPGGAVPTLSSAVNHWSTFKTSNLDNLWFFWDLNGPSFGHRTMGLLWYLENKLNGLIFGKIYYDNEGVSPQNLDGSFIAGWNCKFDDRALLTLPPNNSIGGERTSALDADAPFSIIRNRTKGPITWPMGSPSGIALAVVGTVVKNNEKLEAGDGFTDDQIAAIHRPDQGFDTHWNNLQLEAFPNPRLSMHYEALAGSQHRQGFARHRYIARFPNGGPLTGNFATGAGVTDWSDAGYYFPWYYGPAAGSAPGNILTNGTRQYRIFPGNRGGIDAFAAHRWAGIAIRIA